MLTNKSLLIIDLCLSAFKSTACEAANAAGPESAANTANGGSLSTAQPLLASSLLSSMTPLGQFDTSGLAETLIASPIATASLLSSRPRVSSMWSSTLAAKRRGGKPYDRISNLQFSPDSRRVAYLAYLGKTALLVVEGTERTQYDPIGSFLFSPDSHPVAYAARAADGKSFVAVDTFQDTADGKELVFQGIRTEPNSL